MTHIRPRFDNAACRGREGLYLKLSHKPSELRTMRAICAGCPELRECFAYAVEHEDNGFWAGLTTRELRQLRRKHGIRLQVLLVGPHVGALHNPVDNDGEERA